MTATITDMPSSVRVVKLKPYTLTELSEIYDICPRTLKKWLKPLEQEIGDKRGRFFTIPQVKIIFHNLLLPSEVLVESKLQDAA